MCGVLSVLAGLKHWLVGLEVRRRNNWKVRFERGVNVSLVSRFGSNTSLGSRTQFSGSLGRGSYISNDCLINANIGQFCSVAAHVVTVAGRHPYKKPFASTSPAFYSMSSLTGLVYTSIQRYEERKLFGDGVSVIIGNDCWIGYGVMIVEGCKVSDGAVVLANAVVTKDVPPYAIVGGVPAKILGYRFDEATIKFLLNVKWWNRSDEWLFEHCDEMCDVEKLKGVINDDERYSSNNINPWSASPHKEC